MAVRLPRLAGHQRIATLLALLAWSAAPPAHSATAQTAELTLERALSIAHERGPLMPTAGARRLLAEGRARSDGALPNPTFEWRQENLGSSIPPDVFATIQVPVDITGRRFVLRSAVAAGTARGRSDSIATLRRFDLDVARAFWRAALGEALVTVANSELDARIRLAVFDSSRLREGAVAEVVSMRTRLEADRARMSASQARAELERARADLARMLGTVSDSIGRIAPLPVLTAATLPQAPDLNVAQATAVTNRSDLHALRYAADEAERRATAESRGIISDLQLVSGYKKTSGVNSGVVGVLLPLPAFNRNEGARQRARGEHMLAVAELRDAELRVKGEITSAVRAYAELRDAGVQGVLDADARATEIANISEAAYREGALSTMELIESARVRAETRASALRWTVEVLLAQLELSRALEAPLMVTK